VKFPGDANTGFFFTPSRKRGKGGNGEGGKVLDLRGQAHLGKEKKTIKINRFQGQLLKGLRKRGDYPGTKRTNI